MNRQACTALQADARRRATAVALTAVTAGLLLLLGSMASVAAAQTGSDGSELTPRERYVSQVEPICFQNTRANARILKGVRAKIQRNRLLPASRQFQRAGRAFNQTLRRVKAVPRPAEDRVELGRWLRLLGKQSTYLRQISVALKRKQKFQADRLSILLLRNIRQANSAVLTFPFRHCQLEPNRFL